MKLRELDKKDLPANEVVIDQSGEVEVVISEVSNETKVYKIAEGIEVTLIETLNLSNAEGRLQTEYKLSKNSKLHHIVIGNIKSSQLENYREYNVLEGAEVLTSLVNINTGAIMEQNICNLLAKNAKAEMKLVTIASGGTKAEYRTDVNNLNPETYGDILQRGVVMDGGENIFSGVGFIQKGAHKSHNEQESRVLLLDGAKRGDANPLLLIDDYDVIAGHAASSGKISSDDLYYLMSRGISRNLAERMITVGFLMPVINEIKNEKIHEMLKDKVTKELYG